MRRPVLALAFALSLPATSPAAAETLRIAAWDVGLGRDGAGVLLRDLDRDPDPQMSAVLAVIRAARPDVLLLTGFDDDAGGRALDAFRARLAEGPDGIHYPERFHARSNAGEASGRDLDGDGRADGWNDAWGWGKFPGSGAMVLLSRLPVDTDAARSFRLLPWQDFPGARLPEHPDGTPFPDAGTRELLRLSSQSHWDLPLVLPDGARLHLLAANPTPPAFDGPEGRNRRRNHDEIAFWTGYLDGTAFTDESGRSAGPPEAPVVVLGNLNADPLDGDGLHEGIARLLAHPRLQDPEPASDGGAAAAEGQGGANLAQRGDPYLDTADWRDDGGPGNLRVDYVLPAAELAVTDAGVFWPAPGDPMAAAVEAASAHRLVWVDIALP